MSLILRQIIGYQQGRRTASAVSDPELKKQLTESHKQLQLILNKWKFGDAPITTANQFIAKFEPWINTQLKEQKEVKEFLQEQRVNNLTEIGLQLVNYEQTIQNLREQVNRSHESHGELPEDYEALETERDEAIRDKKTLEQELLATNNRLNLKNQETTRKEAEIERLKQEKSQKETTFNKQIKDWKEKYNKKVQQLDTEQLEAKKLEEEIDKLNSKITSLEEERTELLKNQKDL